MRAGELRHRISIDKRTATQSTVTGESLPSWSSFATNLPCKMEIVSGPDWLGAERFERDKIVYRDFRRFTIRHTTYAIAADMRIKYNSSYFEIVELENPGDRNKMITIVGRSIK